MACGVDVVGGFNLSLGSGVHNQPRLLGGRSHEAYSNRGVSQSVTTISRSSLKQATRVEIDTCSDLNFRSLILKLSA